MAKDISDMAATQKKKAKMALVADAKKRSDVQWKTIDAFRKSHKPL